jgi:DNA-binding NarL/FixJ family response regulator
VLIVDDHGMMREGLRLLISVQPDMEVVGEAENGQRALAMVAVIKPSVIVMDVSMPEMNGVKATQLLSQSHPTSQIVALTRHTDGGYVRQLLRAGASGYVLKQSSSDELVRAIRAVAAGRTYLDPAITEYVVERSVRPRASAATGVEPNLSQREEEVLRMVASGLLSREIAGRLSISIKTAETHKANAMRKLALDSRVDVVRYAVRQGWLDDT